jgi:hypothetical protein
MPQYGIEQMVVTAGKLRDDARKWTAHRFNEGYDFIVPQSAIQEMET